MHAVVHTMSTQTRDLSRKHFHSYRQRFSILNIPPRFQFEANVYIAFKVHWTVRDEMSHSSVCEDVAQCKSMNECSKVK